MKTALSMIIIVCLTLTGVVSCKSKVSTETQESTIAPVASEQPSATEKAHLSPIVPYYYEGPITEDDVKQYNLWELSILRNTIFARAGHVFTKRWLSDYFMEQPWYKPSGFDDTKLSEYDRNNAKVIAEREADMSRNELLKRRDFLNKERTGGQWSTEYNIELGLISLALGETVDWDPSRDLRSPLEDPKLLDELITVKQMEDLSRKDLRILRNMIFARHGRKFRSEILQEYFGRMSWYKINPDFSADMLTDIDQKNIRIVQSVEASLGGPLTEEQHAGANQGEREQAMMYAA
jgi:hypothetical protein